MALPDLGTNLVTMFESTAQRRGDAPFLWIKRNGAYVATSWATAAEQTALLSRALVDLGVEPGARVAIVAENRPEWCIADLAVMAAGGISVPSYTTYTTEDYRYVLEHSGASGVILGGGSVAKRLLPALDGLERVRFVIGLDGAPARANGWAALDWQAALGRGAQRPAVQVGLEPDDSACFIYTSGTGGKPKAVMLSHANIMAVIRGVWHLLEEVGAGDDERFLSFLPLSHSYEHTAGQFLPIAMGAQIYYAESVEALQRNLVEARPSILPCVPRLFEVLRQRIGAGVERSGGARRWLFERTLELGRRRYENGGSLPPHLALLDLALERLVRAKVRERFGGRLKAFVSGGAPLNYEVGLFFTALGLPVLQGYGQTEASPVISVNPPGRPKLDTVGPPLRGVELKIAEDGEILVRGALVMKGYWQDPEGTAAALAGGWLHTGDIGEIDSDGYLKITDRKKDLIVNSGGDNVAPQKVEGVILLESDIAQVIVYGDRRPHLVGLIVPAPELLREAQQRTGRPAGDPETARDAELVARIGEAMRRANQKLAPIERVRRWAILAEPFTVENGLMTPTLKLRRPLVYRQFKEVLEGLYGAAKHDAAP